MIESLVFGFWRSKLISIVHNRRDTNSQPRIGSHTRPIAQLMNLHTHTHTHTQTRVHTHKHPRYRYDMHTHLTLPHLYALTANAEEAKLLQILEGKKHFEAICVDNECAEVVVLSLLEATRENGLQTQQSDHCSQGHVARNAVFDVVHL